MERWKALILSVAVGAILLGAAQPGPNETGALPDSPVTETRPS